MGVGVCACWYVCVCVLCVCVCLCVCVWGGVCLCVCVCTRVNVHLYMQLMYPIRQAIRHVQPTIPLSYYQTRHLQEQQASPSRPADSAMCHTAGGIYNSFGLLGLVDERRRETETIPVTSLKHFYIHCVIVQMVFTIASGY